MSSSKMVDEQMLLTSVTVVLSKSVLSYTHLSQTIPDPSAGQPYDWTVSY